MSFPKLFALLAVALLASIGIAAVCKQKKAVAPAGKAIETKLTKNSLNSPIEVAIEGEGAAPAKAQALATLLAPPKVTPPEETAAAEPSPPLVKKTDEGLPTANRIEEFFTTGPTKLSIVETVAYSSRAPWIKGRPAWIVDYANYYATSRHFIARSLNKKPDYFTQNVREGEQFNVLRKDKDINFYLLIDTSRCKLWFYYIDNEKNERVLLKDYTVGLGRADSHSASGCLTPLGKYTLGSKIAIYKPGALGTFNNQQAEMIRIFGTRWIPFEKEVGECAAPARGYGIHGAPWALDEKSGQLKECADCLGGYNSDGCIRLKTEDMEEIFSIIITKPTIVEIVKDFYEAQLP